jgi:hypothetical protein
MSTCMAKLEDGKQINKNYVIFSQNIVYNWLAIDNKDCCEEKGNENQDSV